MHAQARMTDSIAAEVSRAARGDRDAFARLVRHYQNAVSAVALAMTKSVATSEDVSQAAFIEAWRALPTLRQADSFGPWLMQLTLRQALQQARGGRRRQTRETRYHSESDESVPSADTLVADKQAEQQLLQALEEVPADSRELLLLYYREGRATEQVATLLEISPATVRKRLERAREILRERFDALEHDAKRTAPTAAFLVLVMGGLESAATAGTAAATMVGAGKWVLALALLAVGALWISPSVVPTSTHQSGLKHQPDTVAVKNTSHLFEALGGEARTGATDPWVLAGAEALDPILAARHSVEVAGRVTREDGAPASQASVIWSTDRGTFRAISDESGRYALTLPEQSYRVAAHQGEWAGALDAPVHAKSGVEWQHVDLILQRGAQINGVVRFADGSPAAHASVKLSSHDQAGDWAELNADESGTFSFVGLPRGSFDLLARHASEVKPATIDGVSLLKGQDFFAELRFAKSANTTGVLTDDVGVPLQGWRLRVDHPASQDIAVTGPDGAFASQQSWPLGKQRIFLFAPNSDAPAHRAAWPSGALAAIRAVTVTEGEALKLVVPRTGTIAVHAKGRSIDGRPWKYIQIHIILPVGGFVPAWSISKALDERGFMQASLPAGEYFVHVSSGLDDNSETTGFSLSLKAGEFVERELSAPDHDTVRIVVKTDNGMLVPEARLGRSVLGVTGRDPDGALVIAARDDCPCIIEIAAAGKMLSTTLQPGQREAVIVLPSTGRIHGRVMGASGNFTVQVANPNSEWANGPDIRTFNGNEFELEEVATSSNTVTVTSEGRSASRALQVVAGETTEVELPLVHAGSVKGRVRLDEGELPSPTPVVILDHRTPQQSTIDGRFSFRDVSAGVHTVAIEMYSRTVAQMEVTFEEGQDLVLDDIVIERAKLPHQPKGTRKE